MAAHHSSSIPALNTKDLLAVVAIAEHGSLVGACAQLSTSQSALSRTVTRVERIVGVPLFVRSTRSVTTTPAGREFVAVAERMLDDLRLSLWNMDEAAAGRRGQIIVSSFPIFAQQVLPPLIRAFREARPQVQVQLRTGRNPEVLEDVVSGVADFGITFADSLPDTVDAVQVRKDAMYAVLPRAHPLARGRGPLRLAQLRDALMISLPRETLTRRLVDGAAAAASLGWNHAVVVPGFLEMLGQVRAGVGVGLVPRSAMPHAPSPDLVWRILSDPPLTLSVVLVTRRGRQLPPAASSFKSLVVDELKSATR